MASAPSVESSTAAVEPSAARVEPATSASLTPEIEPGDAPTPTPAVSAAPLGPFDASRTPKTKLALIQAVDAALRAADPARLGELFLDAGAVAKQCPTQSAEATLAEDLERARARAADAFAECLRLVDWSKAEYLILNYGSRLMGADDTCPSWSRHESSELFYVVGDEVYKVKLSGARATRGGHALGGSIRCSKKRGSAAEMRPVGSRFGQTCPGQPWPLLTQVRGACPTLK